MSTFRSEILSVNNYWILMIIINNSDYLTMGLIVRVRIGIKKCLRALVFKYFLYGKGFWCLLVWADSSQIQSSCI